MALRRSVVLVLIAGLAASANAKFCQTPAPTEYPTRVPTKAGTPTRPPTRVPTLAPTYSPSPAPTPPTTPPTEDPTYVPTRRPTEIPTTLPPSHNPTTPTPTETPTRRPTGTPTESPTPGPTSAPTIRKDECNCSSPAQYFDSGQYKCVAATFGQTTGEGRCGGGLGIPNTVSFTVYNDVSTTEGTQGQYTFHKGYHKHTKDGYQNCIKDDGKLGMYAMLGDSPPDDDEYQLEVFKTADDCRKDNRNQGERVLKVDWQVVSKSVGNLEAGENQRMRYGDAGKDGAIGYCARINLQLSKGNAGRVKCDAAMKTRTTASPTSSPTGFPSRAPDFLSDERKCQRDAGKDATKLCACLQTYNIDKNSGVLCGSDCTDALELYNSDGVDIGIKDASGNRVLTKCGFSCPEEESSNTGTIVAIVIGVLVLLIIIAVVVVMMKRKKFGEAPVGGPDL